LTLFHDGVRQQTPPPPKVDVNITIEEKERKPLMPKGERSTIVGDEQRFQTLITFGESACLPIDTETGGL
jgi:hypothetical protein